MRRLNSNSGMTLMEILVVLAIILILIGAAITGANSLRQRADIDLTTSLLDVLDTALQQYYTDHSTFPPVVADLSNLQALAFDPLTTSSLSPDTGTAIPEFWSSQGLFYFLNRSPNSHSIVASVSDSLVTTKDNSGQHLIVLITSTLPAINGTKFDLARFIDSWGTTLDYRYPAGATFPTVVSAGPDKQWDTGDDIKNN